MIAMLVAFFAFHAFKSIRASMLAKRSWTNEKSVYEKYNINNNNTAYGGALSPGLPGYRGSTAKLPLLSSHSIFSGAQADNSMVYNDLGPATSHHDLTQMFISPTKEVMAHGRSRSQVFDSNSLANLNKSQTNLANPSPATNRHSQLIPNLFLDNEVEPSEYSVLTTPAQPLEEGSPNPRLKRKTLPSMYLDDLIDQ